MATNNKNNLLKKHINLIAIIVIGILIAGQDIYIFSVIGPTFDILKGPEGIKDAQIFSNLRNMVTTMITHGLLIGIILLILIQPRYNVILQAKDDGENIEKT